MVFDLFCMINVMLLAYICNFFVLNVYPRDLWKVRLRAEELQGTSLSYAAWTGRSNHLVVVHRNRIYYTRDATSRTDWQLRSEDFQDHQDLFVGLPDWTYFGIRFKFSYDLKYILNILIINIKREPPDGST